jgi:hypothetical protein
VKKEKREGRHYVDLHKHAFGRTGLTDRVPIVLTGKGGEADIDLCDERVELVVVGMDDDDVGEERWVLKRSAGGEVEVERWVRGGSLMFLGTLPGWSVRMGQEGVKVCEFIPWRLLEDRHAKSRRWTAFG